MCELWRNSLQRKLTAIWGLECGRKTNGQRVGEVRERLSFGQDAAIRLREEAIFVKSQKCPYHVTFDLDLDLEHILDAGSSGDHHVLVWLRSSHLPVWRDCMSYFCLNCLAPAYLTELCTPVTQNRSSSRLRSSYCHRLAVPSVKLSIGSRSFSVSGPTV